MNFRTFLRRYEQPITITEYEDGAYDDDTGVWVPGEETEVEASAAVVPLSNDELLHEEGGRYTADDRKMYYHGEITQGQEVTTGGHTYLVDRAKDFSHHASGLWFYMMVRKGESE